MSGRRTSGEIINATLLEIFLSFIFVVLAVAWFRTMQMEKATAAGAQAAAEADSVQRWMKAKTDTLQTLLASAEAQRDSLDRLYRSQLKPYCQDNYVLDITFDAPQVWTVRVLSGGYGHVGGTVRRVTPSSFLQVFASHIAYSEGSGQCRFRVITHDTPNLTKPQYKAARSVVRNRFYVSEQ